MIRTLLGISLLSLMALLVLRAALILIAEPLKVELWTLLEVALPIAATVSLLMGAGLLLAYRKRYVLPVTVLMALGLITLLISSFGAYFGIGYPSTIAGASGALNITVPLDGDVIVAWGGDRTRNNYHAAYPDQRWAYDLVIAPHSIRSDALEDYGCFGETVFAPVGGEIRTAHDGEADIQPGAWYRGPNVFGNYVVIQPEGQTTRLILAHLKRDSLLVRGGDFVEEGQPIAKCGNSGSTTEPHVHIHLVEIVESGTQTHLIGQPLYFRDHTGSEMPIGGIEKRSTGDIITGERIRDFSRR